MGDAEPASLQSAAMFRRLRKGIPPVDERARRLGPSPEAERAFGAAVRNVDRAKQSLLGAVPRGRGPGVPVAEAVAAFEEGLRAARGALDRWPPAAAEEQRGACRAALEESLRRAEALRLEATPQGYEELYALLGHVLDPLDAFGDVAPRLRRGR
jgi:hypothetical protein